MYSDADNLEEGDSNDAGARRKRTPGSNAFVPSVAGLIIAGEVVKDLLWDRAGVRNQTGGETGGHGI